MSDLNQFLRETTTVLLVGVIIYLITRKYNQHTPTPQPPTDPSKEPASQPMLRVEPKPQQTKAA